MISSTDSCRQLVAGNYDVILNEPTAFKTVLTDFLDRCERYENDLLAHQQQQQTQQHGQNLTNGMVNDSNNNDQQNPATATSDCTRSSNVRNYVHEFRMLKELSKVLKKDTSTYNDGLESHNRSKNRYGDIIPFNHTRVILSCNPQYQRPIAAPNSNYHHHHHNQQFPLPKHNNSIIGSDYINANYIRGPSGSPRAYIASQGPLPSTLDDFWRMIWECNVSVIVMACNEHELGMSKCELYWPEQLGASQEYGNIQVTLMRVRQVNSDFLIRKFSVKYLEPLESHEDCATPLAAPPRGCATSGDNTTTSGRDASSTASSESCVSASDDSTTTAIDHDRMSTAAEAGAGQTRRVLMEKSVVQFHIASWPDHGVPDSVQPILELVRLVREVQPFEHTPILVHCSAGCGRTGTICCIDYVYGLMRLGKLDASFDLFNIISDMRRQRMAMVQTLEQYILCHRAVASLFMQQLQLLGHNYFQEAPHDAAHNQRRAVCDAKLALASGASISRVREHEHGQAPTCEGPMLDTSNETSETSYKNYHHHHETSSSADEQQTNSDFQDDDDEEAEDDEEDLGPVFI